MSQSIRFYHRNAIREVSDAPVTRTVLQYLREAYLARVQLWSDGFYATPKLYGINKSLAMACEAPGCVGAAP